MLYLDMLKGVLGQAKGCPEDVAAEAMRDACMQFMTETRCFLDDDIVSTTGTVPAVAGMTEQVVDIVDASIDGAPVLVTFINDPAIEDLRGDDYALTFTDPSGDLTLTPTPTAAVNLRLLRVMAPGPESTGVADVIWLRHSEALKHGCLARLLATSKPWGDGSAAVFHESKFRDAITKVTAEHGINRKQVARRLRVKPA
jgi:hypothetical protein